MKPLLKWAGGKRWLAAALNEIYLDSKCDRLVEPFVGGMSVCLEINPKRALVNDINPHLINLYNQLKQGLDVDQGFKNDKDYYYEQRDKFNQLIVDGKDQTPEAAQLFYYLNRTCFNGLCRFNSKGLFNVPFGQYKTINYTDTQTLTGYTNAFKDWEFKCGDFEELKLEDDDFLYCDPPYWNTFTDYSKQGFDWADQERLAEWTTKHPGLTIVSNSWEQKIVDLYKGLGWETIKVSAPRAISAKGTQKTAEEMLAVKGSKCQIQAVERSTKK
jgi:DNA adenine methylase